MPARRLTDSDLDLIVTMREGGASYGQIAEVIGCSANAISWHCLRLAAERPGSKWRSWDAIKGPEVLQRGGHIVRRFTPDDDAELLRLEAEGLTVAEIARRLGRRWNSTRGRLMTLARRDERSAEA